METTPTLHMWHDYVCPFCNVEATRIMRIKQADHLNLAVRFHPWPLETANGTQPRAEDEDKWVQLLRTVEPDAFAQWNPSSGFWPASSRLLFAAYEAALVQDITAAARFDLMVRQAIFQQPRPIDSIDALCALAAGAGLDVTSFRAMLEDGSAERSPLAPMRRAKGYVASQPLFCLTEASSSIPGSRSSGPTKVERFVTILKPCGRCCGRRLE